MPSRLLEFGRFAEPALRLLDCLSHGPLDGFAIMIDVEAATGRPMGPGTLYAALARSEQHGLIEALAREGRRRPYRLTALGSTVLAQQLRGPGRLRVPRPPPPRTGSPMIGLLLRCYPERWRTRYGEEFAAMLEERPPGPHDVVDILLAAIDARLHLRNLGDGPATSDGPALTLRLGGHAAMATGILWLLVFAGSAVSHEGGLVALLLILLATGMLLIAVTCLSAFLAHQHRRLVWGAFLVPAGGACLAILGVIAMATYGDRPFVGDASPWVVWMLGTLGMVLGSGLFAVASWRVDALPRAAAVTLLGGSVTVVAVFAGVAGGSLTGTLQLIMTLAAMAAFGGGWTWLGAGAVRHDRLLRAGSHLGPLNDDTGGS